jgi:predicted O-methyltransferase YrrM
MAWRRYSEKSRYAVPTMLSEEEIRLLRWATHEYYEGEGEIIDAGCFLGGSTMALAEGLARNERTSARQMTIHTFDRFIVHPHEMGAFYITPFAQIQSAGSFRASFEENVTPLRSRIQVTEGDLLQQVWSKKPVEILFVDVAKTPQLNEHLIKEFFPQLIPGRSLLIQQDYNWHGLPWLVLGMDFFAEKFEILDDLPYGTRMYRCIQSIRPEEAALFSYAGLTVEDAEQAFQRIRPTITPAFVPHFLMNEAAFYTERGIRDRVAPLLLQALECDSTGQVAPFLKSHYPDQMQGPEWLTPCPSIRTPAFQLISQMSSTEAELLYALVKGLAPERALEIGRARGGSTFIIASALRSIGTGKLVSVDPDNLPEHRIEDGLRARLSPWVFFVDGYAPFVLPEAEKLAHGKFNFALIDADHSYEACKRDILGVIPHLSPGAHILLHDAHYGGVRDAVAYALAHLPLHDGGLLVQERNSDLVHNSYNGEPSYYGGFRLLQYAPRGWNAGDSFQQSAPSTLSRVFGLQEKNSRLWRARAQDQR